MLKINGWTIKIHLVLFWLYAANSVVVNLTSLQYAGNPARALGHAAADTLLAAFVIFGWAFIHDKIFPPNKKLNHSQMKDA